MSKELREAAEALLLALLHRALVLLSEGETRLQKAQELLVEEDDLSADYEITLFQGNLPELFCCRVISDGFAAVIVALHHALKNRLGSPLTSDQIFVVLKSVQRLRKEPFLVYDKALNIIDSMDAAGLQTDPPISNALNVLLIDDQSSR